MATETWFGKSALREIHYDQGYRLISLVRLDDRFYPLNRSIRLYAKPVSAGGLATASKSAAALASVGAMPSPFVDVENRVDDFLRLFENLHQFDVARRDQLVAQQGAARIQSCRPSELAPTRMIGIRRALPVWISSSRVSSSSVPKPPGMQTNADDVRKGKRLRLKKY